MAWLQLSLAEAETEKTLFNLDTYICYKFVKLGLKFIPTRIRPIWWEPHVMVLGCSVVTRVFPKLPSTQC